MSQLVKPVTKASARPAAPLASLASARVVSLHEEVLHRLRDYIVQGNLPDGARVPERQLCEIFGVSRTPLREALKVLSSEGLVDLLPNRGARVRRLQAEELRELFDVMGGLEALAGQLACENLNENEFLQIEALHQAMYACYLRRDLQGYFENNQAIHRKILNVARNASLSTAYESLAGRIRRVRYAANLARRQERWSKAMREHEAMLDALRRRDGAELSAILFRHLRNKREAAIHQLDETS